MTMRILTGGTKLFLTACGLCLSGAAQTASETKDSCRAAVIVVQKQTTSPKYEYKIKNLGDRAIIGFRIGVGEKEEMIIHASNTPTSVEAPDGWKGQTNFGYESENMAIGWTCEDGTKCPGPGRSLGGFTVTMPGREGGTPVDEDGNPVKLMDMMKAPFGVVCNGGILKTGRVQCGVPALGCQSPLPSSK